MVDSTMPPGPSRATEAALLALRSLPADTPLDAIFRAACERSAAALGVERVGVWLFIDDKTALRCANLYEQSKREHSTGAVLRVADFPTYFAALTIRKAVPTEVAATAPWLAELRDAYLTPLGITSMLDAGLYRDDELIGVVCHEHVGPPREWTTEARDFAAAVADRLVVRMGSAEVRELRAAFQSHRERLTALDKSAALEQFAAGIAHDFRGLLTIILGVGDWLQSRPDLPAETRRHGATLVETAKRGVALVGQLTEFARPPAAPPAVHDLADLTAALVPVLAAALGPTHPIAYTPPPPLGRVFIDRVQYDRVLTNLVTNARDAMPEGGTVCVRLASVKLTGNPAHRGRYVLVEVSDTGPGIDEPTRRRMFEPYYTTKVKGTGLGLAVVNQIVHRIGGLVRVESVLGQGTAVRLFLPNVGMASGQTGEFAIPPELRE